MNNLNQTINDFADYILQTPDFIELKRAAEALENDKDASERIEDLQRKKQTIAVMQQNGLPVSEKQQQELKDAFAKMKNKFNCQDCQSFFETKGKKIEYEDRLYGHCWKRIANCPACGALCDEYHQKRSSKKNVDFDSYVNDLRNRGGGCNPRSGCCG